MWWYYNNSFRFILFNLYKKYKHIHYTLPIISYITYEINRTAFGHGCA
jgi:uncharacterized membrane protein